MNKIKENCSEPELRCGCLSLCRWDCRCTPSPIRTVFQYADHIAVLWPPLLIPPFSIPPHLPFPLLVFVIWF